LFTPPLTEQGRHIQSIAHDAAAHARQVQQNNLSSHAVQYKDGDFVMMHPQLAGRIHTAKQNARVLVCKIVRVVERYSVKSYELITRLEGNFYHINDAVTSSVLAPTTVIQNDIQQLTFLLTRLSTSLLSARFRMSACRSYSLATRGHLVSAAKRLLMRKGR
jgi:hypothetical protein